MNRKLTNTIRYIMDEWIPPAIRDSKIFMYPFFYIWFKGKHINEIMEFKKNVYFMSKEEFIDFYKKRDSLAKDRETDLNDASVKYICKTIDQSAKTYLDIGCGNGYLLKILSDQGLQTTGCDVFEQSPFDHSDYVRGDIEDLDIPDKAYDIVSACHTIEHLINYKAAIQEMKRVAKKQVVVVVPCQKYFKYTLDEHVNFFPFKEKLIHVMGLDNYQCEVIQGDIVYIGEL